MNRKLILLLTLLVFNVHSQDTTIIRQEVIEIVKLLIDSAKIDNSNFIVEDKNVGNLITQNGTPQYQRFLRLKRTASQKELIALTDHVNPMIRCYSFWALSNKGIAKQLLEKHKNDSAQIVFYTDGDVRYPYTVYGFMESRNRW
jgi:hypothetical protein